MAENLNKPSSLLPADVIASLNRQLPIAGTGEVETPGLDWSEYEDYTGTAGISIADDMNKLRAQNQSGLEKTLKAVGNIPLNIGFGILETAGYLGEFAFDWDDSKDYTNGLIEFASRNKNLLGEVYRENEEVDFSDPVS